MSQSLIPSPACFIIQTALQNLTLAGGVTGWGLSHSKMPDTPDKYVTVYDTSPIIGFRLKQLSFYQTRWFGIMAMVRSTIDYDLGWLKIETMRDTMAGVINQVFTVNAIDYNIKNMKLSSGPVWIGPEMNERKREQFTINWLVKLKRE